MIGLVVVGIAEDVVVVLLQIARLGVVDEIRLGLHRLFGIEVRGEDLVFDLDQFECLLGDGFGNGHHTGNVVAHVAHLVESQRIVMAHRKNAVRVGRILPHCNRNHAFAFLCAARVDALDARVRVRGMEDLADQHAGTLRSSVYLPAPVVFPAASIILKVILATVQEELGLPNAAGLTAELHSLLVDEPNQFFLAHQDSEKDDSMVGTLVATLPSSYTGGELMVGLGEDYRRKN